MSPKRRCSVRRRPTRSSASHTSSRAILDLNGWAGLRGPAQSAYDAKHPEEHRGHHSPQDDDRFELAGMLAAGDLVETEVVDVETLRFEHRCVAVPCVRPSLAVAQIDKRRRRPCDEKTAGDRSQHPKGSTRRPGALTISQSILPPSPFIISTKPGKLVAIISGSSTETGCSAARPRTRWLMAMR